MANPNAPIFATPNASDQALVVASSGFDPNFPAEHLQAMQPSKRGQSLSSDGIWSFTLDFGDDFPVNFNSLLFANASQWATWRKIGAATQPLLDTDPIIDTSLGFGAGLQCRGAVDEFTVATNGGWSAVESFTLELRFRADLIRRQGLMSLTDVSPPTPDVAMISMRDDGHIRFLRLPDLGVNLVSPSPVTAGEFVTVSAVFDAAAEQARLYINGVRVGTATGVSSFLPSPFTLQAPTIEQSTLAGYIQEVRFWSAARTDAEIAAAVGAPLAGTEPNLAGYWKLDDGQGAAPANEVAGPALSLAGAVPPYWAFPERFWASPDVWAPKRHSYYFGDALRYRFERIEVLDPLNPDGFLFAGRSYSSFAFQVEGGGKVYGSETYGTIDPSPRTLLPGGNTLVRRSGVRPVSRFGLISINERTMKRDLLQIERLRGASRDVLVVVEPANEDYRHDSMLYGLLQNELTLATPNRGVFERQYAIEGLI